LLAPTRNAGRSASKRDVRNAGEGSVQSIRRVDVYRVAERPTSPLSLTEEEFDKHE
jgi:hypothetical protein